jgi:hypothetical protein
MVGLGGLLGGLVTAFAVPAWQTYVVETPRLKIEINSITRKDPPDTTLVDLRQYPGLQKVFQDASPYLREDMQQIGRVDQAMLNAQRAIDTLTSRIGAMKTAEKSFDSLRAEDLTLGKVHDLNVPLNREVGVNPNEFDTATKQKNSQYFSELLTRFKQSYQDDLNTSEDRLNSFQTPLPAAISVLKDIKQSRMTISVAVALTNSGRTSVSIIEQALMRVYIGRGNYVDLDLDVIDYEKAADIAPNGTRILSLQSNQISQLPKSDQDLIGRYWDQSEPAIVFVEDIFGTVHSSNPVPFAEGELRRIIHDQLAAAASKALYDDKDRY